MKTHPWLTKLNLNNGEELPHRIMPGPLEGVMSPIFCRAVNELDLIDYWIMPFIRLTTAVPGNKTLSNKLKIFEPERKMVIAQLLGDNARLMVDTVKSLLRLNISAINLNFGCPSKQVIASHGGGKLLQQSDLMLEIIDSINQACPDISLSVKLRTGFSSPLEMQSFLPKLVEKKLDFIIVHSRTVTEMYDNIDDGTVRISQAVKLAEPVPVIASGDVFSVADAEKIYLETHCDGITVARGLLKDPFMIKRLKLKLNNTLSDLPEEDSRNIFFSKMCEIACQEPEYYKRSNFLEIARFMWEKDSEKFRMLAKMDDRHILNFL